jgi:hypothetical protein
MDMVCLGRTWTKDRIFRIVISLDQRDALEVLTKNVCRKQTSYASAENDCLLSQ